MQKTSKKKILLIHNYYRKNSGSGENESFIKELNYFQSNEDFITDTYTIESDYIKKNILKLLLYTLLIPFNFIELIKLNRKIKIFAPDIIYIFNTFPFLSPSVFYLKKNKAKIIFKIANYRLVCSNGNLFRNNHICDLCLKKSLFWGIFFRCYKKSFLLSLLNATNIYLHNILNTFLRVDTAIVFNSFQESIFKNRFNKIKQLSNQIVEKNKLIDKSFKKENIIFIGRIEEHKGIKTIIECWNKYQHQLPHLNVIGNGSLLKHYIQNVSSPKLSFLGYKENNEVYEYLQNSKICIFNSLWMEPFGSVIIESIFCNTPVILPRAEWYHEAIKMFPSECFFKINDIDDLFKCINTLTQDKSKYNYILQSQKIIYETYFKNEVRNHHFNNILKEI